MIQSYLYTGATHKQKHIFCQDSILSVQPYEDIVIAAVSDGCSNAPLSAIGSRLCVSSSVSTDLLNPFPNIKAAALCRYRQGAAVYGFFFSSSLIALSKILDTISHKP